MPVSGSYESLAYQLHLLKDPSLTYGLDKALLDCSVLGTAYTIGCDLAALKRCERALQELQSDDPLFRKARGLYEEQRKSTEWSVTSKVAYLGSLGIAAIGCYRGIWSSGWVGAVAAVFSAVFLIRAGFENSESSQAMRIRDLEAKIFQH